MSVYMTSSEIENLIECMLEVYQSDFRHFDRQTFTEIANQRFGDTEYSEAHAFIESIRLDRSSFFELLKSLSINTTEMFRDLNLFAILREKILPELSSYPSVRVWSAGCSTGEEAISLLILFAELGLLSKVQIYATDFNPAVIRASLRNGISLHKMKGYSKNYYAAGGQCSLLDYFDVSANRAYLKPAYMKHIVFSVHNLLTDSSFNEFQLIMCRNVMIYYDAPAQQKMFSLFAESLTRLGYLIVGKPEASSLLLGHSPHFQSVSFGSVNALQLIR